MFYQLYNTIIAIAINIVFWIKFNSKKTIKTILHVIIADHFKNIKIEVNGISTLYNYY